MEGNQALDQTWDDIRADIESIDPATENWKNLSLPLARIKKIMKSEEFVMQELEKERLQESGVDEKPAIKFMIAGEAPVVMSKAAELLIQDLSSRAWQHTERNRRRTLQRQDIHAAVGESETYDFLIDIVPRVTTAAGRGTAAMPSMDGMSIPQPMVGATMGAADPAAYLNATVPTEQAQPQVPDFANNQYGLVFQQFQGQDDAVQPNNQQQHQPQMANQPSQYNAV